MIDKIEFGRTGHKSTRVLFGAASLGRVSQKVADQTLDVQANVGNAAVNQADVAMAVEQGERGNVAVAGGEVNLELKTVEQFHPLHEAQLLTYLRLSSCRVGLLINFNTVSLTDGIRRRVL